MHSGNNYDLETRLDWFNDYVRGYASESGSQAFLYELKREHTLLVVEEAMTIHRATPEMLIGKELAHAAALYHDLGRFVQVRDYGTLSDAKSANHALLSLGEIDRLNLLSCFSPYEARLIKAAIFLHNRPALPATLRPALAQLGGLVRDADKLDIMRVSLEEFAKTGGPSPDAFPGLRHEPGRYSRHCLESLLEGGRPLLAEVDYVNDYLLFLAGWIYDLNLKASFRAWRGRGINQRIFALLPDKAPLARLEAKLAADLDMLAG